MQDRLSKPVAIFGGPDFSAGNDDLLGDACDHLMRCFATESGKSMGEFHTVCRIMVQVVGIGADTRQDQTICDPTCGSGSPLPKAVDQAPIGIAANGREIDGATWALARTNLFLHRHLTAGLWRANTTAAAQYRNKDG